MVRQSSEPFVSVVTPCFNGEKYLAQCIESVLSQSYQNWEYLIVNNVSTDRSLEIANSYASKDKRIRVITNNKHLHVLANMNHALRQVSGDSLYCKLLCADDWLFPECLSRMVELAEANPEVGIVGSYRLCDALVDLDGLPYPSTVISGREVCRMFFLKNIYVFGSPSSVLFRARLIHSRPSFYPEGYLYGDGEACFELLQRCDFGFVHQVLTFCRVHNESQTAIYHINHPTLLTNLNFLKKYGPIYLTHDEYENCLNEFLDDYHRTLALSVLQLRGMEFWHYNNREMKKLRFPISLGRLVKVCCREAMKPAWHFAKALRSK